MTITLAGSLLVLGVFSTAAPARRPAGAGQWMLSPGAVGPLRIGVSTERQVLAAAGPPTVDLLVVGARRAVRARYLGYGACRGSCNTAFWIDLRTGRLSDFRTTSTRYRTGRGTRVGTPVGLAERSERSAMRGALGCADSAIVHGKSGSRLWLGISEHRVRIIYVGGSSSLVYPCTFGLERDMSLAGSSLIG